MTLPSPATEAAIYATVRCDLAPPSFLVHAKVASSVAVGGLTTLFLCGQFGLGLTEDAAEFHRLIMSHFGMLGCSLICGVLFAFIPVVVLRLWTSALQFRYITRRRFGVHVFWTAVFGTSLALASGRSNFMGDLPAWFFAAVFSLFALLRLVDSATNLLASSNRSLRF